ncbi:MAG: hypothetical protein WA463_20225 [Terriglobales bacterium]
MWVHLIGLDTAVVCAAVGLLLAVLLMLRLCLLVLLVLMLRLCLLVLLRFALLLTPLLVLCVGTSSASEKQEQNCCADNASSFHFISAPF